MEAVPQRGRSVHGVLLLVVVAAVALLLPPLAWPWYLLVPLVAYAAIVLAFPPLRRSAPPLRAGRMSGGPLAFAVVLALVTSAVLLAFHHWVRPDVTELARHLPVAAFGNLILAAVCFSILNAAMEEALFRGVLWAAIADEWNEKVALAATAGLFGLAHLRGYPPGPAGAALACVYGAALGVLRWWTGGLGLGLLCHICADATIFTLLWRSGALGESGK